ncbi:MAG: NAD(P)-binding protein, partial [Ruminiclostridium sp.]|nr:NAD(P)-binding protein [Ruminiclostridium sp.]
TPNACPAGSKGCGALEIIGEKFTVDESFEKRTDILPAELGFRKALDCEFTEYAYVIHDKNYAGSVSGIKEYFAGDRSFRLLGRWGTWNYKNMDLCMLDAMELVRDM